MLGYLIDNVFKGSYEHLVNSLARRENLSREELMRIVQKIDSRYWHEGLAKTETDIA